MGYKDNIRKVTAYVPGEQPKVVGGLIKLNTNENPYPPSPKVKAAVDALPIADMRLYPDTTAAPLAKKIADYHGLEQNQVFVGVGSDDVLATCFLTFFAGNKPILFPDITYSFYDVWADLYKIPYKTVPLDDDFNIRAEDYKCENGGVVIANPNAPTSIAAPIEVIEDIIASNPESIVIIDEAYIDYGGESALNLLDKYENLVVVRTFSKSRAFAGMRIGYAMASGGLIDAMNDVKFSINSYTMNCAAIRYGIAAVEDEEYFREQIDKVIKTREFAVSELSKLGFTCPESSANFIFAAHESIPAVEIFEYLKSRNIYVRYFKKPRIDNRLRITIGTDDQMKKVIEVLKEYINK